MAKFGKANFERRVFPRFKLEIPITFEPETRTLPLREGQTEDVSAGGLLVNLPDPVQPGDRLRIRMRLTAASAHRVLDLVCRVTWAETRDGQTKAGLAFEELSPEDREFIEHFQGLWLEQSF